jgi:hypothetical protein
MARMTNLNACNKELLQRRLSDACNWIISTIKQTQLYTDPQFKMLTVDSMSCIIVVIEDGLRIAVVLADKVIEGRASWGLRNEILIKDQTKHKSGCYLVAVFYGQCSSPGEIANVVKGCKSGKSEFRRLDRTCNCHRTKGVDGFGKPLCIEIPKTYLLSSESMSKYVKAWRKFINGNKADY